jgi:hypothetical protein
MEMNIMFFMLGNLGIMVVFSNAAMIPSTPMAFATSESTRTGKPLGEYDSSWHMSVTDQMTIPVTRTLPSFQLCSSIICAKKPKTADTQNCLHHYHFFSRISLGLFIYRHCSEMHFDCILAVVYLLRNNVQQRAFRRSPISKAPLAQAP